MQKLLYVLLALLIVNPAFAAMHSLYVGTGVATNPVGAGDAYITTDIELDGAFVGATVAIPVDDVTPDVAAGNTLVTGVNTVPTAITALDNELVGATYTIICGDVANASTIADAGNFALNGAWAPATIGDSITLYVVAADTYYEVARSYVVAGPVEGNPFLAGPGAVGVPTYSYIADPDSGRYWVGANSFADAVGGVQQVLYDGTGIAVTGINGPVGTVAPDTGIFTTVDGTDATFTGFGDFGGDFQMGQDPDDLHTLYKARGDFITYQDDFIISVDTEYILDWDLTGVVGAGTNTVSVRPGWSEMVTGGAGVDSESVQSFGLVNNILYAPRMESVVDLTNLVTQRFEWGFYIAANECVLIVYDVAIGANWVLQVDDTAGIETIDSLVPGTVDPTKLEIAIEADGTVHWAINDVAMTEVGLTNQMTANPHYTWWELTDTAAAAHTVAVDYVIIEQLRQQ